MTNHLNTYWLTESLIVIIPEDYEDYDFLLPIWVYSFGFIILSSQSNPHGPGWLNSCKSCHVNNVSKPMVSKVLEKEIGSGCQVRLEAKSTANLFQVARLKSRGWGYANNFGLIFSITYEAFKAVYYGVNLLMCNDWETECRETGTEETVESLAT